MKTGRWIAAIVVVTMSIGGASGMVPGDAAEDLAARASKLLASNQPRAAVELLEEVVLAKPSSPNTLVDLLKEAYRKAADQARAGGETQAADEYLENLTILNRRSPQRPASEPLPRPVAPAPAPVAPPMPTPAPVAAEPISEPASPPAAQPKLQVLPPTEEPLAAAPEPSVREADTDFINKEYLKAGKIYAQLAAAGKLPPNRNDHWAYCRSVEVARRINARPMDKAEWDEIDREIAAIRQLSPKSWVGGYLRKLADERSKGAAPKIRGATPFSNELDLEKPLPPVERQEAVPRQPPVERRPMPETLDLPRALAPSATAPPVAKATTNKGWQIIETDNFRIYHHSPEIGERVAQVAEQTRAFQGKRWGGSDPLAWAPRCDVYVYNDGTEFAAATKQSATSPGFSTISLNEGIVTQRLINLRGDHPGMLDAVLPHEITHVVVADFFRQSPIPRWADEGIAVLSEPEVERRKRASDLSKPLETGQLFRLEDLMRMDFPEGKDWPLYYAQSVSLTSYLVGLDTPAKFLDFLEGSRKRGVESELRRVYRIENLTELRKAWVAYARTQVQVP